MKIVAILISLLVSVSAFGSDLTDAISNLDTVQIQTLADGRQILADSETGLTLYTFDVDGIGFSNCFDSCLVAWPAKIVSTEVPTPFGIHERDNGDNQLMLNDQPLYFFQHDQAPLDINGDGVGGVWHLVEVQ